MPVHENIELYEIEKEIKLLKRDNRRIYCIIPTSIDHIPGSRFGIINRYAIVFSEERYTKEALKEMK